MLGETFFPSEIAYQQKLLILFQNLYWMLGSQIEEEYFKHFQRQCSLIYGF